MDTKQQEALSRLVAAYSEVLSVVRPGWTANSSLRQTPQRAAKALLALTTPEDFSPTVFEGGNDASMVLQSGIFVASLCEHHIMPYFGTAVVAYLPGRTKIGLSKLARLVRWAAAGLTTQEQVTENVGRELMAVPGLEPKGVGVSLRCYHTCMSLRGVKDVDAVTTTTYLAGVMRTDSATRLEFLASAKHPAVYQ